MRVNCGLKHWNQKMMNSLKCTFSRSAISELKFLPPPKDSSSSRVLSSSYSWTNISAVGSKSWSSDDKEPTDEKRCLIHCHGCLLIVELFKKLKCQTDCHRNVEMHSQNSTAIVLSKCILRARLCVINWNQNGSNVSSVDYHCCTKLSAVKYCTKFEWKYTQLKSNIV